MRGRWNGADFYDLFGPVQTGRKGYVFEAGHLNTLVFDEPRRLVRRYGIEAAAVVAAAGGDQSLLEPIEGTPVLGVELLFGLRHEGALGLDDLLDRRTRVGLIPEQRRAVEAAAASLLEAAAA